jgi:hypothetical protein
MKIAVQISPHNNISTPPNMAKPNDVTERHENDSHQQQSQGNVFSRQQVKTPNDILFLSIHMLAPIIPNLPTDFYMIQVDMILEFMNKFVQLKKI